MAKKKANRKKKDAPREPSPVLRWVLGLVALGVVGVLVAGGTLAGLFFLYGKAPSLPRISSVHDYKPSTVTRIFDRRDRLVGELFKERRTMVGVEQMPKLLIKAVVAAEDADFFKHRGLDYFGMLRAFFANVRAGRFAQGGSTITQQVVKTFFLSPERTIRRKMQEVILARRLENELTKEEILFLYLNQIYFGHGNYGVQEASRYFFNRPVQKLTLAEHALLAGLPQSPNRLSPLRHPARAKKRQTYVLGQMARLGFISADVKKTVARDPIRVVKRVRPHLGKAPELLGQVETALRASHGKEALQTLGLTVRSTLDVALQAAAQDAVQWGLRALDARQGHRRRLKHLKGKALARTLRKLKRSQKKFKQGRRYLAVVTRVDDAGAALEVDLGSTRDRVPLPDDPRYNPQGDSPSKRFSPGDLIRVRKAAKHFRFEGGPQAALVAMDPRTGDVLAMVGGYRYRKGDYNRAVQAKRQPGSSFKPFVYAAGLQSGKFTPATVVDDAPVTIGKWRPRNFDGKFRGPMRLRQALAHSINSVAAKVMDAVGVEQVRALASGLGITSKLGKDLSLALGTSEVTPLELATAYCALANGGRRVEPRFISTPGKDPEPADADGPGPDQALSPEAAFLITNMMQSVVQEGTGRRARRLRRQVAGKTGTTNNHVDAWFAGFTPQLVTVVWVGFDSPRSLGRRETGGRAALPIWVRFMQRALKGKPILGFTQPAGIVRLRIDPESGLLAPSGATAYAEEYFKQGTEPKETATAPDQVDPGTILMDPGL